MRNGHLTFFQRRRNGHLPNTRNTNLLPHIFIDFAIENTCLYPRKTEAYRHEAESKFRRIAMKLLVTAIRNGYNAGPF